MTLGLFEKAVLADGFLGPIVDLGRNHPANSETLRQIHLKAAT
jgi:hypothetical protein